MKTSCFHAPAVWAALLAAPLMLLGCESDPGVPIACAGPQVCPPPSSAIPWSAQLWPNSAQGGGTADPHNQLTPQEDPQLLFDASGVAQLSFTSPAVISGSVSDASGQPVVGARVVALLPSAIPGQNSYSFDTLTVKTNPPLSLRIPVPRKPTDQLYRFWVGFDEPAQANLHPPQWQDKAVTGDTMLPLRLRAATELATIQGRVVNPLGAGVAGMTVQVVDAHNQVISSTAVTSGGADPQAGTYRVLVGPFYDEDPMAKLTVVVRPGPQNNGLPTLDMPLPPPAPGTDTRLDFAIPSYRNPVPFKLPIYGTGTSGASMAVQGAHVQVQVELSDAATMKLGHRAIYTAAADTDASGVAKLMLVPAPSGGANLVYKVTVGSPARTVFASLTVQSVQVGQTEGTLTELQLPLRPKLHGRLVDAQSIPVANARVVAQSIASSTPTIDPLSTSMVEPEPPQTTTDEDGRFALWLDPGDYDLDFVPVAGTQPRSSLDNQRITMADLDLGVINLPRITLGKVLVSSPLGAPVAQAKIRIFQLPDTAPRFGLACVPGWPCSRVAKLRAEALTDSRGRAQFLLPDSAPAAASLRP